jgi:hypothetical protein
VLSQSANGLVESGDSEPVELTPVDKFAPAAPSPVTLASANGVISLFWPASVEKDVTGYQVYRSESPETANENWVRLNPQPLTTVTFHDDRVVIGKKYFYRVTAIDRFDNESEPSTVVSETASH